MKHNISNFKLAT